MPPATPPKRRPASWGRWEALTPVEQLAAVREVCGTRVAQLKKRFEGVLAIGAGYKKSKGEVSTDICLGFLVEKKRKRRVQRPVPARVVVELVRDGKKVRVAIPTDIEELGRGRPHGAIDLGSGVRASNQSNSAQGVPGAVCCVVEQTDNPLNRYLLGCHHVLALSLLTQSCNAIATNVQSRLTAQVVAQLFEYLPMSGTGQPCLDAAIALVEPGADVTWSSSGVSPSVVEPGVDSPTNCAMYTPDGLVPARFVKEWANIPLRYPKCGTVVIEAAYQFQAATVGGHSGSPVMSPDGTLHGMHFWGDPQQLLAFALPAFVLFRPGLFSVTFQLP